MEMLFIVTLFAAITKTRFSGLKWSSATILFHTYRKFDVNLPKAPSFCKKNASFIENNLPFMGIMFLSRKEAKGSSFRCLAIPVLGCLIRDYLHNEGVVPMLIFDLVYTLPSTDALLSSFWINIDDNPTPLQMAENGIKSSVLPISFSQ